MLMLIHKLEFSRLHLAILSQLTVESVIVSVLWIPIHSAIQNWIFENKMKVHTYVFLYRSWDSFSYTRFPLFEESI